MSELEAAAAELEAATQALREALRRGDAEGLEAADARREQAFAQLSGHAPEALPESVRTRLGRLAADEPRLLEEACAVRDALRHELEAVARARQAARTLRPEEAPRFVSRRV